MGPGVGRCSCYQRAPKAVLLLGMDGDECNGPLAAAITELPAELLEVLCAALADDLCAGVSTIIQLTKTCHHLHGRVSDPATVRFCAAQYGVVMAETSRQLPLELLGIAETIAAMGTNRIFFQHTGRVHGPWHGRPVIRPGSSMPRLAEFALLLRSHPRLTVTIEGHEATQEGIVHLTDDGRSVRTSFGGAQQRAEAVRDALLEHERLERVGSTGAVWGSLPSTRFASRITSCRGWEDAVVEAAGWSGRLETCQVELFFSLDGVEVPSRGSHYKEAEAVCKRHGGWPTAAYQPS